MCKGYTQKYTEYITPSFVIEFWKMINCTTCFAYKPNFLRKYIIYKQILKFVIGLRNSISGREFYVSRKKYKIQIMDKLIVKRLS